MNKGKYIFLDVDGVLNHHETYKKKHVNSLYPDLDPECLALFSKLVYSIDYVHIVLSSSWRLIESDMDRLEAAFKEFGIPKWIDITPYLEYEQGKTRGKEINQWLKENHVRKDQIIILDDNTDMADLQDRLIQTDFMNGGFKEVHFKKALHMLKGNHMTKETKEILEALEASNNTLDNLYKALNALDSAKSWSIADILGGGFLMTYMKRSRVKEAQVYIDNCKASIEKFAKELHDVNEDINISLDTGEFIKFADYFFDGILVAWYVQSNITTAQTQVSNAISRVEHIKELLLHKLNGASVQ